MLGSEYNWLVTPTRTPNGVPQVRMAGDGMLTLAIAVFCLLAIALRAAPASTDAAGIDPTETIPNMDGIIEGLAIHPVTHESFLGDVHNRCIWSREGSGGAAVLRKFSADSDGLLGVFALKFDDAGRTLWASSSAVPEMKGGTSTDQERAFLARYDLSTRRLERTYALPADGRKHVLGDFLLGPDGMIYATDSVAPVIWRLAPGADHLENWLENPGFKSLQGVAFSADGHSLYVADYSLGLWRIDLAGRSAALVIVPAGTNLRGIDGLYAIPGGMIAIQNGLNPPRILHLTVDEDGAGVRARELRPDHPAWADLSLGQVIGGRFHFIANSGWDLFPTPAAKPPPHGVQILSTALD
jgi:hypothetical protein